MSDHVSDITPPRRDTIDGAEARNLQYMAFTTTHAAKLIAPRMRNRWVRLKAIGGDVSFIFAPTSSGEVDHTLTGDQPVTANIGWTLLNGEEGDFLLGGNDNYVILEGSASGTLKMLGSGGQRNGKEGP
jgi:hypothetical protein